MAEPNTDLIIPPGFFAFVMDTSKGEIRTEVGPFKVGISNTDRPVRFDPASGEYQRCIDPEQAKQAFIRASENDYIVLDNPASEARSEHPQSGRSNSLAELSNGKQIVVPGPAAFALWPGQKAKVVAGHRLRSNQYLIVEVLNPDAAKVRWADQKLRAAKKPATLAPAEQTQPSVEQTETDALAPSSEASGVVTEVSLSEINPEELVIGQRLVIKGTAVSFYMPITGLAVVPDGGTQYVREAVTLERMQYCRLISESGTERIELGPKVVFPAADEAFTKRDDAKVDEDARVFRAIELNDQMGIYIKVTADYSEAGHDFHAGEELFITGAQQRIYYPRIEHSLIRYGGAKDRIYAVMVPVGKGYYVLDKREGKIGTRKGPCLLLPDPRHEVIVQRVLDARTVALYFPGNTTAAAHNRNLQTLLSQSGASGDYLSTETSRSLSFSREEAESSLGRRSRGISSEVIGSSSFDRGTEYTPPRTITLDDKYGGAVGITVWPGFAVQVVSKSGSTRIVKGHSHTLLDYDETLTELSFSTGTPKSDKSPQQTVFLRINNNRVSDQVSAETKDMVEVKLTVAYQVNFEGNNGDKWFVVSDYVQLLTERMRSVIRAAVKEVNIEQLIERAAVIVRDAVLGQKPEGGKRAGYLFEENSMRVSDLEVLETNITDASTAQLLITNQTTAMRLALQVSSEESKRDATKRLEKAKRETALLVQETSLAAVELAITLLQKRAEEEEAKVRVTYDRNKTEQENALELAQASEAVAIVTRETERRNQDVALRGQTAEQQLALVRLEAEARVFIEKLEAISPDLVAAVTSITDKDVALRLSSAMAPIALLHGTGVNELLASFVKDSALGKVLGKAFRLAEDNANNGHQGTGQLER